MLPVAPVNNVIVTLEKKLYDSITFQSGIKLHIDPSWHPEEYAMLEATVVTVPKGIINRFDYKGMKLSVKPGDRVLIRYDVVFSYRDQPERDTPIYKNLILLHDGQQYKEYWLCDIQKIFAIIKDGEYNMLNGYVLLDPITEKLDSVSQLLVIPDSIALKERKDVAIVRAIGAPLDGQPQLCVQPGEKVIINPRVVQQYQIDTRRFFIIKQQYLLAAC